ncbi:hypothetical protein [Kitasatospora sp. NPDC015120]|uniref:hypothetical protein n=1 Tax=Kitasatospora sp. NPDC015120 TaxID=3364023 RepID=UPI0036F48C14
MLETILGLGVGAASSLLAFWVARAKRARAKDFASVTVTGSYAIAHPDGKVLKVSPTGLDRPFAVGSLSAHVVLDTTSARLWDYIESRRDFHGDFEELPTQFGERDADLVRMASDPDSSLASSHLAEGLDSLFRTLGPPPMSQAGDSEVVLVGDGGGRQ